MVKLMRRSHNHELAKSLVIYPYFGRLTKDEKTIMADMTKSMVRPRNILLTLKEQKMSIIVQQSNKYIMQEVHTILPLEEVILKCNI